MVTAICPSRETLLKYSIGMLNGQERDALNDHLESCSDCQAMIMTLDDTDDTVVGRLRMPPNDSFMDEPQLQAALKAAMELPSRRKGPFSPSGIAAEMPKTLGEYQVLEELGRGGMGRVYKARHTKLNRVVAVKLLARPKLGDPQAISRFEREMQAIGLLDHPNIVQAYDAREIDDMPVLIMEFVDGLDLAELVRRVGPLPVAEACELVRRTALALQYAQEHGLVHRDIKPSNIMLSKAGEVKLLDLGLARFYVEAVAGEEMTGSGQAMGTADYMAPEQASDSRTVDIRADIYSLGCTLYKLLSGRAPFSGPEYRGTLDKMNAHVQETPPSLSQFVSDLPEELKKIVERMITKDPADRFATPADVAAAIEPFSTKADLPELIDHAVSLPRESWAKSEKSYDANFATPRPATAPDRRRPIVTYLLIGMAFSGMMALSFGAGIWITINKDGKETKIDIPPGSTARVGTDGQVELNLRGTDKSTGLEPQSQEKLLQFGPEIEKIINSKSEEKGGEALNLSENRLLDLPQDFNTWPVQKQDQWSMENKVDLLVDFEKGGNGMGMSDAGILLPKGLKLTAIATRQWDVISNEELELALKRVTAATITDPNNTSSELIVATVHEKGGVIAYLLPNGIYGYPPWTFAFQTRNGNFGILQVIRFTEEPRGMRIRYKLAQSPFQSSPVNPAAELKALQGPWKVVRIEKGKDAQFSGAGIMLFGKGRVCDVLGSEHNSYEYRIDPTKEPKTIDLFRFGTDGRRGDPLGLGIYQIDGDNLKICLAEHLAALNANQRASSFQIESNSADILIVLQREHPSADEKLLQGDWEVASQLESGKALGDDPWRNTKFRFADHEVVNWTAIGTPFGGKYVLDATKQPPRITMFTSEWKPGEKIPRPISVTLLGIYKIDGDRLTIAYRRSGPAPDKFESAPGSGVTLLELKRAEAKSAASPANPPKAADAPSQKTKLSDAEIGKIFAQWESRKTAIVTASLKARLFRKGRSDLKRLSPQAVGVLVEQYRTANDPTAGLTALIKGLQRKLPQDEELWDDIAFATDGKRTAERSVNRFLKDDRADLIVQDGTPIVYAAGKSRYGTLHLSDFSIDLQAVDKTKLQSAWRENGVSTLMLSYQDGWISRFDVEEQTGIVRRSASLHKDQLLAETYQLGALQCPGAIVFPEVVLRASYLDDELNHVQILSPISITVNEKLPDDTFKLARTKGSQIIDDRQGTRRSVEVTEDVNDIVEYLEKNFPVKQAKGDEAKREDKAKDKNIDGGKPSPATPAQTGNPAADAWALVGPWRVVSVEKGKKADLFWNAILQCNPNSDDFATFDRIIFNEWGRAMFSNLKNDWRRGMATKIIPTTMPKQMDIFRDSDDGKAKPPLMVGIYELKNDTLKIRWVKHLDWLQEEQRPKNFDIDADSADLSLILKRPFKDEKDIQGAWRAFRQVEDGKEVPNSTLAFIMRDPYFAPTVLCEKDPDGKRHNLPSGRCILDAEKQPKTITIRAVRDNEEKPKNQELFGVYQLEGNQLIIAYRLDGLAPDKFESTPGSGVTLLELKRSEPKPTDGTVPGSDDSKKQSGQSVKATEKEENTTAPSSPDVTADEIPLALAIQDFNKRMASNLSTQNAPPLTEEEVISLFEYGASKVGKEIAEKRKIPRSHTFDIVPNTEDPTKWSVLLWRSWLHEPRNGVYIRKDGMEPFKVPVLDPSTALLKTLQGSWQVASVEKGKATDWLMFNRLLRKGCRYDVLGNQLVIRFAGPELWGYRIEVNPKPNSIRLYDNWGALFAVGLFELKDERLTLSLVHGPAADAAQWPAAIAAETDSQKVLLTLQRYQPSVEEEKIEGDWSVVKVIEDGKLTSERLRDGLVQFFDGFVNNRAWISAGLRPLNGRYFLQPENDLKRIDFNICHGIYRFDGDHLTIAYRKDAPAPEKFESTSGSGVTLLELKFGEKRQSTRPDSLVLSYSQAPSDTNLQGQQLDQGHRLNPLFKKEGFLNASLFLRTTLVPNELALTDAQKEKLASLIKEFSDAQREILDQRNKRSSASDVNKMRDKLDKHKAESMHKLQAILEPHQLDRLAEIMTQYGALGILDSAEAGNAFEYTEGQWNEIKSITDDYMKNLRTVLQPRRGRVQDKEKEKKHESLQKEAVKKILQVLTPKQRAMFEKMKGKEIDTGKLAEEFDNAEKDSTASPKTPATPLEQSVPPAKKPEERESK